MHILLLFISTVTSLAEGTFIKKYNSKHSKGGFFFTGLVSLFSMTFFILTDTDGLTFSADVIVYGIIAGILYCTASLLTYIALGCGSFAMSMLLLSYSGIFSIGYGLLFLGDKVGIFTYIGIALMLVSLFLFRGKGSDDKSSTVLSPKWLICISLSVVGSGMYNVVQKMQQIRFNNSRTNEFMVIALSFSAIVLLTVGIIKDGKDAKYILKYGGPWSIGAGLSNGATNMISLIVNTMLPFTIVSPLRSGMKMLLSFILSVTLFKEKLLKRQIIGVVVGTLAIILLNLKF